MGYEILKVYVDACVLNNGAVGIGILCPDYPSLNTAEPCPKNLGSDINLGFIHAIIRTIEKTSKLDNLSHLIIITNSSAAVDVARTSHVYWPGLYDTSNLWLKFLKARDELGCTVQYKRSTMADHHHLCGFARQLARKGAEKWCSV